MFYRTLSVARESPVIMRVNKKSVRKQPKNAITFIK